MPLTKAVQKWRREQAAFNDPHQLKLPEIKPKEESACQKARKKPLKKRKTKKKTRRMKKKTSGRRKKKTGDKD